MTSNVRICNLALSHLIAKPDIVSLDPPDGGAYAKAAASFFPFALKRILADCDWYFARKRKELTKIDYPTPANYLYCYLLPTDTLQPRFLIDTGCCDNNSVDDYLIEGQSIFCNIDRATLVYTASITDISRASIQFESAASMLMASLLVGAVSPGNQKMKEYWYKMYEQELSSAIAANDSQRPSADTHMPKWITDR